MALKPASEILSALAYAGLGAGLGTIGAAAVAARADRPKTRAEAAAAISEAATSFVDRLMERNNELAADNRVLRKALLDLADAVDEVENCIGDAGNGVRSRVHAAMKTARLAL